MSAFLVVVPVSWRLAIAYEGYNGEDVATRQGEMSSPDRRPTARNEADDNLAAYEAGLARIEARLKTEHPELFDESGEIRSAEVSRIFIERAGGKTEFTLDEFLALVGGRDGRAPL
jgi:hypothetical protein